MKIYHIDRQNSWTGQANRILLLSKGLTRRGHETGIITNPKSQLSIRARNSGIEVFECGMKGWRFNTAVFKIAEFLKKHDADIVHCHGPRDHLLCYLLSRLGYIKHIVRTKHNHKNLKSGFWSRLLYVQCSKVVAVSEYIKKSLEDDGVSSKLIETIYDVVDTEKFSPRAKEGEIIKELNIHENEIILGCVSSLHERKGIEEILRAFKKITEAMPDKKIRCVLSGKGGKRWEPLIEKLNLKDRVILTGFRTDVDKILSVLDIYVLPSRQEALGTSILEAMSMGLPVVVSNVGGIPEAVTPGAGIMVPPNNANKLAEELILLINNKEGRKLMGMKARKRIQEIFSLHTLIDRTEHLYHRILEV